MHRHSILNSQLVCYTDTRTNVLHGHEQTTQTLLTRTHTLFVTQSRLTDSLATHARDLHLHWIGHSRVRDSRNNIPPVHSTRRPSTHFSNKSTIRCLRITLIMSQTSLCTNLQANPTRWKYIYRQSLALTRTQGIVHHHVGPNVQITATNNLHQHKILHP